MITEYTLKCDQIESVIAQDPILSLRPRAYKVIGSCEPVVRVECEITPQDFDRLLDTGKLRKVKLNGLCECIYWINAKIETSEEVEGFACEQRGMKER